MHRKPRTRYFRRGGAHQAPHSAVRALGGIVVLAAALVTFSLPSVAGVHALAR
jgi:hypothetical protein